MSKLIELIEELCPEGVEYKPLGELLSILDSQRRPVRKSDRVSGPYPYYGANGIQDYVDDFLFEGSFILLGEDGSVLTEDNRPVTHWAEGKIWVNNHAHILAQRGECFDLRFAFYALTATDIRQFVSGGSRVKLNQSGLRAIPLPVPPLEVQCEIVRVLDAFIDLEQSLMSELELRKKQLKTYRQGCFASVLEEDGNVVNLCDVVEVRSGWGFPRSFQGASEGELPFFKVGDMNLSGNSRYMTWANNYISETDAVELKIDPAPAGTVIFPKIGAAIATNKKRILTQDSAFDNNVMGLVPHEEVDSDYLFHWIQTVDLVRWGNSSGGVPSIRKTDVAKVPFFLPERDLQETLARMFNAFESLIQTIEQELILRRKQYAFYRDELLTFKSKEV